MKDVCNIAMEECAELIQALSKYNRNKGDYDNLCEEIADTIICIEKVIEKFKINDNDIEELKKYKIMKLEKRLEKHKKNF